MAQGTTAPALGDNPLRAPRSPHGRHRQRGGMARVAFRYQQKITSHRQCRATERNWIVTCKRVSVVHLSFAAQNGCDADTWHKLKNWNCRAAKNLSPSSRTRGSSASERNRIHFLFFSP